MLRSLQCLISFTGSCFPSKALFSSSPFNFWASLKGHPHVFLLFPQSSPRLKLLSSELCCKHSRITLPCTVRSEISDHPSQWDFLSCHLSQILEVVALHITRHSGNYICGFQHSILLPSVHNVFDCPTLSFWGCLFLTSLTAMWSRKAYLKGSFLNSLSPACNAWDNDSQYQIQSRSVFPVTCLACYWNK